MKIMRTMFIAILVVLFLASCAPRDKLYCETASDCNVLAHDDCRGEWSCVDKRCSYECAEAEAPIEEPEPAPAVQAEPIVVEAVEETTKDVEAQEEPEPAATDETIIEGITYTQRELDSMAKRNIVPMSDTDPRNKYIFVGKSKWNRFSTDKVEIKEMVIKFMNVGDKEFPALLKLTARDAYVDGKPSTARLEFTLPDIPPGFKLEKEYPINIIFHEIEVPKKLEITLQDRLASPNPIMETWTKSYTPIDELESMEIKWT